MISWRVEQYSRGLVAQRITQGYGCQVVVGMEAHGVPYHWAVEMIPPQAESATQLDYRLSEVVAHGFFPKPRMPFCPEAETLRYYVPEMHQVLGDVARGWDFTMRIDRCETPGAFHFSMQLAPSLAATSPTAGCC